MTVAQSRAASARPRQSANVAAPGVLQRRRDASMPETSNSARPLQTNQSPISSSTKILAWRQSRHVRMCRAAMPPTAICPMANTSERIRLNVLDV